MGLPIARYLTFQAGDTITREFLNEWVQDHMIDLRTEVDALTVEQTGLIGSFNAHAADDIDPHGAIQEVTGKYVAPMFELSSGAPDRVLFVDGSEFVPGATMAPYWDFGSSGTWYSSASDATGRKVSAKAPFRPGDTIQTITVKADRNVGTLNVEVFRQNDSGYTLITTLSISSGTGPVSSATYSTPITLGPEDSIVLVAEFNNASNASATKLKRVRFTYRPGGL